MNPVYSFCMDAVRDNCGSPLLKGKGLISKVCVLLEAVLVWTEVF